MADKVKPKGTDIMTSTFDFTDVEPTEAQAKAFRASVSVSNMLSRLVAAGLMVCALGLWFSTNTAFDAQMLLFKLGMSLVFAVGGIALYNHATQERAPDVEFDQIRRELRIVKRQFGNEEVVFSKRFEELGEVEMKDNKVVVYDVDGTKIVEVDVADPKMYRALRRTLQTISS